MPALSVDFGGTAIKIGVVAGGDLLAASELRTTDSMNELALVAEEADRLLGDEAPSAVGIAVPGIVDRAAGGLLAAHEKQAFLLGRDLRAWVGDVWDVPAVIENDGRAALLGELTYGCAAGQTDAVMLTLGTGIGTAAAVHGRLLRGAHDHAGVLGGHFTVDVFGARCNCGNLGCAETIGSSWALAARIRRHLTTQPDPEWESLAESADYRLIFDRAAHGDRIATAVRDEAFLAWGATATSLCHAYDPEVLVLSGGVLRAGGMVRDAIESHLEKYMWSSAHRPRILLASRPEFSALLGLSALVEQELS